MKRTWTLMLLQNEQPDPAVWDELKRLADAWSAERGPAFDASLDFMRIALFDEASKPALDELVARLDELKRTRGAAYRTAWRTVLEDEDYAKADFLGLLGADLDVELVTNEEAALAPGEPCPRCGAQDTAQTAPFAIDERVLDHGTLDGRPPGRGGWDVVNLPNGHALVSSRVVSLLEENGVRGYQLLEVTDAATGRPSARAKQLLAVRAVLEPCMEHSRVEGDPFCPVCGTAYGVLDGYFRVRSDRVDGVDVVSRHRGRGAMLYVARRVFDLLRGAGLNGLVRNDALFVCRHDG